MRPDTNVRADPAELRELARQARCHVVRAVAHAGAGHLGGPLSAMDILTALYFSVLNVRPEEPLWPDRDRFVLSKGHCAVALYAMLAMRGYFDIAELATFDAIDSRLQGHPDMALLPGVDMSSGSLGLGFSAAVGIALGARALKAPFTTYALLGDGECNEGIVWEGAHVAGRYELDNLVAIIDCNGLQQYGWRDEHGAGRLPPYRDDQLAERWSAFGWRVLPIDGHDMEQIVAALEAARPPGDRPTAVVAATVKGKGVSFMEDDYRWHAKVPDQGELARALAELGDDASSTEGP